MVLTHALAALAGLVLGAILMRSVGGAEAEQDDLVDRLIDILNEHIGASEAEILGLLEHIALLETDREVGPCSAQGGCDCPPDEEVGEGGYEGWV